MTPKQALEFAEQQMALILADKLIEARERYDGVYEELYPSLQTDKQLSEMAMFFYLMEELLTWPEAVRMGAVDKGLLHAEYEDMLRALAIKEAPPL